MSRTRTTAFHPVQPVAAALLLGVIGCAHGTLSPPTPVSSDGLPGKVGAVNVTLGPSVSAERRAVYERLDGNGVITREIAERLGRDGRYGPAGDNRIDVRVDVFRLRSTANTFWNGLFAGIDMLEGEVAVSQPSAEPVKYSFKLSGSEDLYFKYSAGARFRSLARALATKVSALLRAPGT